MVPRFSAVFRPRTLLLASVCGMVWAGQVTAREIVPEKPSVEVNYDALQGLRNLPPINYAPPSSGRNVPAEQRDLTSPSIGGGERKVPAEQPISDYAAPSPAVPIAASPPVPKASPPVSVPVTAPAPKKTKKPAPVAAPVKAEIPKETPVEKAAPAPAPVPVPAALPEVSIPKITPAAPAPAPSNSMPDIPAIPAPAKPATPAVAIPELAPVAPKPVAPDISKLDFSKFPKDTTILPPPNTPVAASKSGESKTPLSPAPNLSTSPMMVPVPKDAPPLPPSVENRLNNLGAPAPDKQGVVSDTTTIKDPTIEMKKKIEAEQEKQKAAAAAAANAALNPPNLPPMPAADVKAVQPPTFPVVAPAVPPVVSPPTPPAPTNEKLPPSELPKTPVGNMVPALPKLPGLDAPKAPPSNLPSLSAITGGTPPNSMDILQPKSAIESKPLPSATSTPPALPVMPALPKIGGDDGPIVKRAVPEVNVGATPDNKADNKKPSAPPALPVLPTKPAEKSAAPAKPVTLPAPPVEAKPLTTTVAPQLPPAPAPLPPVVAPIQKVAPAPEPAKIETPKPAAATNNAPPPPALTTPPLTPDASDSATTKLTRSLTFDKDKTDLSDDAKSDLNDVAEKAKQSQGNVRIVAYASGTPEQASIARRISLSRALQIRAFLIGKGVNQLNINVQALGNQVPSGNADRADIFTK